MLEPLYQSELYQSEFFIIYTAIAAFLTGLITAMGGSGGLVITPFLISAGLPIHLAIGTAKFSSLGLWAVTIFKFKKADKIEWDFVRKLTIIAVIGSIIGASITVNLDKDIIYFIAGLALVIIAPIGIWQKNIGLSKVTYSKKRENIGYILYFFTMIFAGFFGAGAGTFALIVLTSFLGLTALKASATSMIPLMCLTMVSSSIFMWHGYVDYRLSITILIGMALGSWMGANIAIKGGSKLVKYFALSFAFIVGVKMLWESFIIIV